MSSSVAGAGSDPFGITGQLGVGIANILGGNAQSTSNAASIEAAGTIDQTSPFYALSQSVNAAQSPTLAALQTGKLTASEHAVLQSLSSSTTPTSIPWNTDGSEPTTLANMRSYGWIKMVTPDYDPSTRLVTSATYQLTPVGEAISKRTGGAGVSQGGTNVVA